MKGLRGGCRGLALTVGLLAAAVAVRAQTIEITSLPDRATPGGERIRLDPWFHPPGGPSDGQPSEVVIRDVVQLPEPGAGWLRAVGAGLLAALARRRARRAAAPEDEDEDADADEAWEPDDDEPVEIPIGDSIDLHFFPPRDVGELVDAYLEAAAARGFREVRIIHGRGRGVQRNRVRRHLERSARVEAFADAPAERGGWGATLVRLRVGGG